MAVKVIMPKQGLQMTEGTILAWLVSEGSPVQKGQPLFEMETDKVTITIDSPAGGVLLKVLKPAGATVPVSEAIAFIGAPGESVDQLSQNQPVAGQGPTGGGIIEPAAAKTFPASREGGRKSATPRARMRAEEMGIDADQLTGSGPEGLVVERDVLAAQAAGNKPPRETGVPEASVDATPLARRIASLHNVELEAAKGTGPSGRIQKEDILRLLSGGDQVPADLGSKTLHRGREAIFIPHSSTRKVIAKRTMDSLTNSAQAHHTISVDCFEILRLREYRAKGGLRLSLNAIFVKVAAEAIARCPTLNSEFTEEGLFVFPSIDIGVAVALENGLVVPVLRDVKSRSLEQVETTLSALIDRARAGVLTVDEAGGSTFTVTNLGMFEIDSFTAIIQRPENAILALGVVKERPVAKDGSVVARPTMNATLTYDHRAVDGAPAAVFLKTFRDLCENPYLLV